MATEESSSLPVPLLIPEVARMPPITITKNESQESYRPIRLAHKDGCVANAPPGRNLSKKVLSPTGASTEYSQVSPMETYVISRGNHRVTITPRVEPEVTSDPTPSFVVDCNSYVPQPCNYQTLASGSFVGPTTSSDSYSNISQLTNVHSRNQSMVLQEPTSFQNDPSRVMVHSGNMMSNPSCQNDSYSSLYASSSSSDNTYSSSNSDVRRASYSGNVLNTSVYRPTMSSSSTSSTSVSNSIPFPPSVSVELASYSLNQASTCWSHLNQSLKSVGAHPTFSSSAQSSSSHLPKDVAGSTSYGTSIQYVDLTFSNDSGHCHNLSSNSASNISDGNSHNSTVASSSTSSVNYIDSSQEFSKMLKRTNPPYTDSQLKIKNVLSEITLLMKNVRAYIDEYKERPNETPPKLEEIVGTDYMAELQRFNKYSSMNPPPSQLLPRGKKLFTVCREQCQKYFVMMVRKENLTMQDEMMVYTMKLFLINLKKLYALRDENSSAIVQYENAPSSTTTAFRYTPSDLEWDLNICHPRTDFPPNVRERIEKYEKMLKYKDFKINYLKTVLDEKKDVEKKLEETKQKYAELEEKLKQKKAVGCWREDNISEWCCELMSELKTTMLDLMENEFKCCICDELLIEPGVTNCQHIFCTFCLNTWREKKKECPVCRALITNIYKVNSIDEYITAATSSLSDKAYAERLQVIEDRKNTNPPPAKKPSWSVLPSVTPAPVPAPVIPHPRPSVSPFHSPYPFTERNSSWHSPFDRLVYTTTGHHTFPSSTDIPTSGPWSQLNIPLNTGASRRSRPTTVYYSPVVATDPPEARSLDPFP